jgi:hypothetical protein
MQRFNREGLEHWLSLRQTKLYLAFLRDQQAALGQLWARGQPMSPEQQAKALLMGELASLSWADYATFYGLEDTEPQQE